MNRIIYLMTTLVCLGALVFDVGDIGFAIYLAIWVTLLSARNIVYLYNRQFSLSSALITYTIFTQFGLIIPYYFWGDVVVSEYASWTLEFLSSPFLAKSVKMGALGISVFETVRLFVAHKLNFKLNTIDSTTVTNFRVLHNMARVMLLAVFLFFAYHILTGGMRLFGTYEMYMASSAYNSSIYSYILIVFYIATIYLTSSGSFRNNKFSWTVWFVIVVIFAMNGNKGEFMYVFLASLGVYGLQGHKISWKLIAVGTTVVFFVIPSITSLRMLGISQNISSVAFNPFAAFAEMGMQLRTTVYTLESLHNGTIDYLYGQSYWQPVLNVITPFAKHHVATDHLKEMFPGYGYCQIAEGYLNFGLTGIILFYGLVSYYLTYAERKIKNELSLSLLGANTTVLINATRNYFAFVPGQLLIVLILHWINKRYSAKS